MGLVCWPVCEACEFLEAQRAPLCCSRVATRCLQTCASSPNLKVSTVRLVQKLAWSLGEGQGCIGDAGLCVRLACEACVCEV
jgi:hypothetical protein